MARWNIRRAWPDIERKIKRGNYQKQPSGTTRTKETSVTTTIDVKVNKIFANDFLFINIYQYFSAHSKYL